MIDWLSQKALLETPKIYPAKDFESKDIKSLFYEGLPWRNNPTRTFVWYGIPEKSSKGKFPAMVLVHGGGGTAFDAWVRLWNSRGYAAIAMDTCGCVPKGVYGAWNRHEFGGPAGWGGFEQMMWNIEDQWTYHAVADVILAHSLLRSFPEVDPDRIGLTGISWGGYLTCITAGVDYRFKFAVPVYGCGFLGENSAWLPVFANMGEEKSKKWLEIWDPSHYLKKTTMPMLWVTGTNDFAYPMDSHQKSYRATKGSRTLCIRVRMPHGHGGAGENPEEIHIFANNLLKDAEPLAKIIQQGSDGNAIWAKYDSVVPIVEAELNFTRDTKQWSEREWIIQQAQLNTSSNTATAKIPDGVKACYLNLKDERNLIVSSEYIEIN